jgi:HD superfamily phosphodiesterase
MSTAPEVVDHPVPGGQVPPRAHVADLARDLLAGEGTRLLHVRTAGFVATRLSALFNPEDAELLIAAATLHDIGYSARIAHTGFHPLDGGAFLRAQGYPERLARLVAQHSLALMTAPAYGIGDLAERFPREDGLLADALAYADMHSAPDGQLINPERRLADIARRHPDREHAERADQLRAAITRVRTALLDAGRADLGTRPSRIPAPAVRAGLNGARDRLLWGIPTGDPSTGLGRPIPRPAPEPLSGAFYSWWFSESQYTLALDLYQPGTEDRAAALRLARLRARADRRRDRYFRAALV